MDSPQVKELDDIMTQFVGSAKDGTFAEKGFKGTTYGMSKVGLSALTRIQQQEFDKVLCVARDAKKNKLVNVCVFVQLIRRPTRTKNQLYKNPNLA